MTRTIITESDVYEVALRDALLPQLMSGKLRVPVLNGWCSK